jgi:putative transcriptional regulator
MIKFRTKVLLAMNDMNQKDLAEITGVRPSTISAMCTGAAKHIPVDVLDKICTALHCQPGDLMEHIPEQEQ